jgi:hypothetical protein
MEKYQIVGGVVAFIWASRTISKKMFPYLLLIAGALVIMLKAPILGIYLWMSISTHLTNQPASFIMPDVIPMEMRLT